jgi:uncharacterized protein
MGAILDALHRLQQLELELLSFRTKINAKHRSVRGATTRVKQIGEEIAAKRDQLKHEQAGADRAELDRKSKEQEIAKLREALNRAKTNKEYQAILTQFNTDKLDNMKLEERVLAMYTSVDQMKAALKELEEAHREELQRLKGLEAAAVEFESSLKDQITTLERQRNEAAAGLPASALTLFERVCERHEGEALAPLVQPSPRREEFICGGCNMTVPVERANALRSRDEIQTCSNCGRLLYVDAAQPARR